MQIILFLQWIMNLGKPYKNIEKDGIDIRLQQAVYKAENLGNHTKVYFRDKNGAENSLEADYILVAVGRKPYTENLGLENTGVKLDERGFIVTDEKLQSSVPDICYR